MKNNQLTCGRTTGTRVNVRRCPLSLAGLLVVISMAGVTVFASGCAPQTTDQRSNDSQGGAGMRHTPQTPIIRPSTNKISETGPAPLNVGSGYASETPGPSRDKPGGAVNLGPDYNRMSICLFEAEQLNRLGTPAQKNLVVGLYRNIRAAQQYEPMAGKLAVGTSNTVGPLYQFAINDACNAVSQGLLTVLKKQVPVAGGGRD